MLGGVAAATVWLVSFVGGAIVVALACTSPEDGIRHRAYPAVG